MNDPRKEEGREVQGDRREVHQEWGRERERDRVLCMIGNLEWGVTNRIEGRKREPPFRLRCKEEKEKEEEEEEDRVDSED